MLSINSSGRKKLNASLGLSICLAHAATPGLLEITLLEFCLPTDILGWLVNVIFFFAVFFSDDGLGNSPLIVTSF